MPDDGRIVFVVRRGDDVLVGERLTLRELLDKLPTLFNKVQIEAARRLTAGSVDWDKLPDVLTCDDIAEFLVHCKRAGRLRSALHLLLSLSMLPGITLVCVFCKQPRTQDSGGCRCDKQGTEQDGVWRFKELAMNRKSIGLWGVKVAELTSLPRSSSSQIPSLDIRSTLNIFVAQLRAGGK